MPKPPEGGGGSYPGPEQDPRAVERLPRQAERSPGRSWVGEVASLAGTRPLRFPRPSAATGRGVKRSGALPIDIVPYAAEADELVLARGPVARFCLAALYVQLCIRWRRPTQSGPTWMEQEATKPEGRRRTDRDHGWHAESHSDREWSGTECTGSRQAAPSGALPPAAVDSLLRLLSVTPWRA